MEGYKEGKKHGETRAMQPAWLEQKDGPPKYTQKGMPLDRISLRAASGCKMEVRGRTTCTTSAAAFAAPR